MLDRSGAQAAVQAAVERFGRIDVLVNNAGIYPGAVTADTDEETFDRVYAVNVKSIYWSVQAFVPYFREQGGGIDWLRTFRS